MSEFERMIHNEWLDIGETVRASDTDVNVATVEVWMVHEYDGFRRHIAKVRCGVCNDTFLAVGDESFCPMCGVRVTLDLAHNVPEYVYRRSDG